MSRVIGNASRTIAVAVVAALLSASAAAAAAPGSLDASFGGGVVSVGSGTQLFGVTVAPGGVVVAAGQSGGMVLVQRFTSSGQRDGTYSAGVGVARAASTEADGKVVIAGSSGGMFAQRFNLDGSVDTSFGSHGIAAVPGLGGSAVANAVAVQPDGKIVVAGTIGGSDTRIAVARFNTNGTLDTSFGSGGAEEINLGLPYEAAEAVAVQRDGKIVLSGHEQGSPYYAFFNGVVVRLQPNGTLDPSFASSGVLSYHHVNSGYDTLNAVAIQNDGKIVAAGSDVGGPYAVFLRLDSNGSYDTSFGSGGETDLSSGTFTSKSVGANGVVIAGGGRVVAAGAIQLNGTDYRAGLWALSSAGAADRSFGSVGIVEQPSELEACGMAIQPDGNLVVVGDTVSPTDINRPPCSGASGSFTPAGFVARYVGFGPPPVARAPLVTTGGASAITATSATLSGQVDPGGVQTSYRFIYGTTTAYGSSTALTSAGAGVTATAVRTTIGSLVPGTTYHYALVASNADGFAIGSDGTFTTASAAPSVGGQSTTGVGELSAKLVGHLNPRGLGSSYHFEYGRTRAYGSRTRSSTVAAGASSVRVTALVKHLRPGTRYHYRLVVSNSAGTTRGGDSSFRTAPLLRTKLGAVGGAHTFSTVIAHGISFKIGCNQGCSVKASLLLSSRTAKHLGVITRQALLGAGSGQLRRAGTVVVKVRLSKRATRELRNRTKTLVLTLAIVTTPAVSGHSHTVTRRVTFKR